VVAVMVRVVAVHVVYTNFGGPGGPGGGGGKNSIDFQDMISPSDFWGKYTLAKK
jgi:hypothetical protein